MFSRHCYGPRGHVQQYRAARRRVGEFVLVLLCIHALVLQPDVVCVLGRGLGARTALRCVGRPARMPIIATEGATPASPLRRRAVAGVNGVFHGKVSRQRF